MNILLDNISAAGGSGYVHGGTGTIYLLDTNLSLFISDDSTPTDVVDYYVGFVDISFTSPINESTFTASDVVLTAPSGTIIGISNIVKLDTITGRNVYRIEFAQQRAEGQYSLRIGPNITSESGNLLDQDHNGVGGETADVYIHGFTIDYLSEPDLMVFLEAWLTNGAPEYDFVDDNIINIKDFAVFSSHWLGIDR